LQPLDVSLSATLTTFYGQELNQFTMDFEVLIRLTKRDFFHLFWIAFGEAFIQTNIKSWSKKTGLHPFQPEVVLDKFLGAHCSRDPPGSYLAAKVCNPQKVLDTGTKSAILTVVFEIDKARFLTREVRRGT
jgi:hypothetical protein